MRYSEIDIENIRDLVRSGVLDSESCPQPNYWHWRVKRPDDLPNWLLPCYIDYGEIRCYWVDSGHTLSE